MSFGSAGKKKTNLLFHYLVHAIAITTIMDGQLSKHHDLSSNSDSRPTS
jgi:hypothetical protein